MRKMKMKELYKKANELLKIRRAHPVVSEIYKVDKQGEVIVFDDKEIVEREVVNKFTDIYKRRSHVICNLQPDISNLMWKMRRCKLILGVAVSQHSLEKK
jgi:hypothetical protein